MKRLILIFLATGLIFSSCEKEKDHLPIISTTEVTEITQTTAMSGGNITDDRGEAVTARGVCWSMSQNPTISDSKTEDGGGVGSFTSSISGLEPNTMYYIRAYATSSRGTGYGSAISFSTLIEDAYPVVDIDGNVYPTFIIGNQVWMAENLKTTKYNDGTDIPYVTNNSDWRKLTSGAYCWQSNNPDNGNSYGALYNWYAVFTDKLCPTGWHVPTDAEWEEMENYLANNGYNYDGSTGGGRDKIAKALASDWGWDSSSSEGAVGNDDYPEYRNKSGFTALPGGFRHDNGSFSMTGWISFWWSASELSIGEVWYRSMYYHNNYVERIWASKEHGYSVRCLRD